MTRNQQLGTTSENTFTDPALWQAELRADIRAMKALASGSANGIIDAGFQTRPTILRRLGALIAKELPATLDQMVTAPQGVPLTTAVCLYTGLPFTIVQQDMTLAGEIRRGERIAVIHPLAATAVEAGRAASVAQRHGADVLGVFITAGYTAEVATSMIDTGQRLHLLIALD